MSGHRAAHDLAKAPLQLTDPGDAGIIAVDRFGGHCEVVTAAAETRTLADPTGAGLLATIRLRTDGGDLTVTAANGLNVAANTTAVFNAVGEQLFMTSVETATAGTFRWEILVNTGSVALS
jgi:hypothetical protein